MTGKYSLLELEQKAYDVREDIIKMLLRAGEHGYSGHTAGPLGLADIFTALYFDILKHDPKNPDWDDRDILILSNGHCVPVRYVTMAHVGYFPKEELMTLRDFGSRLQGHPERTRLPGMETTSGPLGSGLSQAVGMALALHIDSQSRAPVPASSSHRWVYVVVSDGEQNEGNTWEGAMLAAKYKLDNLIAITDRNNIQIDGPTEHVMPLEDLKAKWEAFGWHVIETDGNNIEGVIDACAMARAVVEKPVMIIAHTIPGKGVDFMEYDFHWHGGNAGKGIPDAKQAKEALRQLRSLNGKIKGEHE